MDLLHHKSSSRELCLLPLCQDAFSAPVWRKCFSSGPSRQHAQLTESYLAKPALYTVTEEGQCSAVTPNIRSVRIWCFYSEALHNPQNEELPSTPCCYFIATEEKSRETSFHNKVCVFGWWEGEARKRTGTWMILLNLSIFHPGNDRTLRRHFKNPSFWAPRIHKNWVKYYSSSGFYKPHLLVSRMNLFCLMSRTLGLECKVLILTWEPEFSRLAALGEGSLLFFWVWLQGQLFSRR